MHLLQELLNDVFRARDLVSIGNYGDKIVKLITEMRCNKYSISSNDSHIGIRQIIRDTEIHR